MNLIAMLTVTFIIRPELASKTFRERVNIMIVWLYNLLLWFVVEDVGWFVANNMTYRSAPWQTTGASVMSTLLPLLIVFMKRKGIRRDYSFDWILLPVIIYIWIPFGTPFDASVPFTPRRTYCNGV